LSKSHRQEMKPKNGNQKLELLNGNKIYAVTTNWLSFLILIQEKRYSNFKQHKAKIGLILSLNNHSFDILAKVKLTLLHYQRSFIISFSLTFDYPTFLCWLTFLLFLKWGAYPEMKNTKNLKFELDLNKAINKINFWYLLECC